MRELGRIKIELQKLKPKDGILESIKNECRNFAVSKNANVNAKKPLKISKRGGGFLAAIAAMSLVVIIAAAVIIPLWLNRSGGLEYKLINNTFYEVSIGKSKDKNIIVPEVYKNLPVQRIAENGFRDSGIKSIVIPDSVIFIDTGAFSNCKSLENITVSNNVTDIKDFAFFGCIELKNIIIPDSVVNIGTKAFKDCKSLQSVIIPVTVLNIATLAFDNCENLTIYVDMEENEAPATWDLGWYDGSVVEWKAPENTQRLGFTLINNDTEYEVSKGDATIADIVIPARYKGLPVTAVAESGFKDYSLLSILIPDSVEIIGNNAFSNCSSLTNIVIPDSVTKIGMGTFDGCSSLINITIPFIGNELNGVTDVYFGYIFGASSYNLQSLPESLTTVIITGRSDIGSNAFYGCHNLKSITIPNGVGSIGDNAFSNCIGLMNIVIPDSVTNIGKGAFGGCNSLENITIPFVGNGTTKVHFGYIFGADGHNDNISVVPQSLTTVIITGSTGIGSNAFFECSNLKNIIIPNSVTSIGSSAFLYCSSLENITIPNSVKSIGINAFSYCSSLKSITIPNSVTTIGENAFLGSELTIYAAAESRPLEWHEYWNNSSCPVIWGCELFFDGDKPYVNSFITTVHSVTYNAPYREGYIFECWKNDEGTTYDGLSFGIGTKLIAHWNKV